MKACRLRLLVEWFFYLFLLLALMAFSVNVYGLLLVAIALFIFKRDRYLHLAGSVSSLLIVLFNRYLSGEWPYYLNIFSNRWVHEILWSLCSWIIAAQICALLHQLLTKVAEPKIQPTAE
ncbi:hypothetical protein [Rubritalea marina]|uniref:hypothetical protein n=1 Tax=Rubritalea marina TaxID=361055 RepID=UPI00035EFB80|nr:hypothetical protein [Rubritalea marina]